MCSLLPESNYAAFSIRYFSMNLFGVIFTELFNFLSKWLPTTNNLAESSDTLNSGLI